jgi:multiple sugar transport system permease protein
VLLVVPAGNLVSLLLALGLSGVRRLGTFYKVAYYLPVVISIAVVAVLWRWLYNTEIGLLNVYLKSVVGGLRSLGLPLPAYEPIPWLANPKMVMPSIALMSIWWGAGGNMICIWPGWATSPKTTTRRPGLMARTAGSASGTSPGRCSSRPRCSAW